MSEDPIIQYLIVRKDLLPKWSTGALIAQACHASIAVIWEHRTDPDVIEYAEQAQQMRKVVLEAKDESQLNELSEKLNSQTFLHKLWIEQPENIPTCIAVKPYRKSVIGSVLRGLRLFK